MAKFKKGESGNPSGRPRRAIMPDQDEVARWVQETTSRLDDWGTHDLSHMGIPNDPSQIPVARTDGWASAFTGHGRRERDKRETYYIEPKRLTYQEIIDFWENDELGERAITAPPAECMRQGYEITIADEGNFEDLKEDIEHQLIKIEANKAIERAHCLERAFGGSAILLGVDDGRRLDEPLETAQVRALDWLTVIEPIDLVPETYYGDIRAANYGKVKHFRLNSSIDASVPLSPTGANGIGQRALSVTAPLIHESRLIIFNGDQVSRYGIPSNPNLSPFWGRSKVARWVDSLRDFHIGYASAGLIIADFSQAVISIDNLMALVAKDSAKRFHARMAAIEMGRSTARAILLDTKEKYERQSTSVAGLPDLLDRLAKHVAAAIDMPLSMIMGYDGGLGSNNAGDIRAYYDKIRGLQNNKIGPVFRRMAELIMGTLRKRKLPKKWGIRFNELWQQTDKEKADARLTKAREDTLYVKAGIVTPDEIRKARFVGEYSFETQVDASKKAPGIAQLDPGGKAFGGVYAETTAPPGTLGTSGAAPNPAGAKTTATAHAVRPYARRNPIAKANPSVQVGGAVAGGERADGDVALWKSFAGLAIAVENPRGSIRTWTQQDGRTGATKMRYDYGFIAGAVGADGEEVDVYLGPNEAAEWAYIVHQNCPPDFVIYDEDKVMLGFDSPNHARDAYVAQYDNEQFFGGMSMISVAELHEKLADGGRPTEDRITCDAAADKDELAATP